MSGVCGQFLEVDLTRRSATPRRLDPALHRRYLGGRGLAVRLLWDALPHPHIAALGAENAVVFATGPFTGLPIPGASRTSVVTKSPATAPGDGAAGASSLALGQMPGHFAVELKYAGYDALVVRGRATEPVALVIRDDRVEFRPAQALWGKEIPAAEADLRTDLPREPYQVVAIGPAGEQQLPLASAVHSQPCGSHAGRGGIGAVLGAKNLKAIAVRGTLQPFDVARPTAFESASRAAVTALQKWPQFETWRRYGTACLVEAGSDGGLLAVKNFREGTDRAASRLGAVKAESALWVRSEACFYCPLHCRKVALVRGAGGARAVAGPEFETSVMLGSNCGVTDLAAALGLKDRCDRLGLDPSSAGNVLGFVTEAAERGLLLPSDLDGIAPTWGDAGALAELLEKLGRGEGCGAELARGVRALATTLGGDAAEWAMQVKGLEMDAYNVPALAAMVLVYGTSNAGAVHRHGHSVESQDQRAVSDSLGLCRFHTYTNPLASQATLLATVTGEERTVEELARAGTRIWNLERAFNAREGFTAADDRLPARCKQDAFTVGPRAGAVLSPADEAATLTAYYVARGWDPATGRPRPDTLDALGLQDVAASLRAG